MNAKEIIQARINELESEMKKVVETMQTTEAPQGKDEQFRMVAGFKDQILTLRAGIAELKNIEGLL